MKIFCHEIFFCHKGEQYCFQKISRNIVFQKNQISKSPRSRVKDEQYCFQKFKFQTGQSEQYCFQKNSNFLAQQSEQYCLKKNLGHVQAEVKTNSIVFKKNSNIQLIKVNGIVLKINKFPSHLQAELKTNSIVF